MNKLPRPAVTLVMVWAFLLTALGCPGDPSSPSTPVPTAVTLSVTEVTLASIGETKEVAATVKDRDGATVSVTVAWTVEDTRVATVSGTGVLTAVANGTTTLHAAAGTLAATASITVRQEPAQVVVIPSTITFTRIGDTVTVVANVQDARGAPLTDANVIWTSSDPAVATVSVGGLVRATGTGTATLDATVGEVTATASLAVSEDGAPMYRWTFSEEGGPGTVFRDDIRGAEASIVAGGAETASAIAGQVTLTGGAHNDADYVALPPGLLSGLTDGTIEIWATLHARKAWSRVFDAGSGPFNNLFVAWSQGTDPWTDRAGFTVGGTEDHLDNTLAPFAIDLEHHIVVSIDEGGGEGRKTRVALYLDGEPSGWFDTPHRLRELEDQEFWLGRSHYGGDETANASYDELAVHDRALDASEVHERFLRGPARSGPPAAIAIAPPSGMRDTIRGIGVHFPLHAVGSDALGRQFPLAGAQWSSSDPSVAAIDSAGMVSTFAAGQVDISAALLGGVVHWAPQVIRVRHLQVDPYLATPIAGALWEVPVVLIEYLPTADGFSLDTLKAPDFYWSNPVSLDSMETQILTFAKRRKMMVEEGSRFRGYSDPAALPSLAYRVVDHIIVYDQMPPHPTKRSLDLVGHPRFEDWFAVFDDLQLRPLMEAKNVKELWVAWAAFDGGFPSYDPEVFNVDDMRVGWESNMSSPTTGDISNSDQDPNDAPVLSHTYIIYGINYRRSQSEAVHNVGHQLERMMSYAAWRQDGDDRLFWRDFVGQNAKGEFITGRAGWTHMPPNTTENYDYYNTTPVASDIEDWRPDHSGKKALVNVDTWTQLTYPWPGEPDFPQRGEAQWYTFWFQNYPGRGNTIPHGSKWMTNWWTFVADWDAAVKSGLGLYAATPAATAGSGEPYLEANPRLSTSTTPEPLLVSPARGRRR